MIWLWLALSVYGAGVIVALPLALLVCSDMSPRWYWLKVAGITLFWPVVLAGFLFTLKEGDDL